MLTTIHEEKLFNHEPHRTCLEEALGCAESQYTTLSQKFGMFGTEEHEPRGTMNPVICKMGLTECLLIAHRKEWRALWYTFQLISAAIRNSAKIVKIQHTTLAMLSNASKSSSG